MLILTKPLGTGVITTAIRSGKAESSWIESALEVMSRLNKDAAASLAMLGAAVHGVTDITGFGFLGHAWEMASASGVSLRFDSGKILLIQGALECARGGFIAAGLKKNQEFLDECVRFADSINPDLRKLLLDPQTSGGLLVSIQPEFADEACFRLEKAGCYAMQVGRAVEKTYPFIEVF
jgi:selenide,water dikinase